MRDSRRKLENISRTDAAPPRASSGPAVEVVDGPRMFELPYPSEGSNLPLVVSLRLVAALVGLLVPSPPATAVGPSFVHVHGCASCCVLSRATSFRASSRSFIKRLLAWVNSSTFWRASASCNFRSTIRLRVSASLLARRCCCCGAGRPT